MRKLIFIFLLFFSTSAVSEKIGGIIFKEDKNVIEPHKRIKDNMGISYENLKTTMPIRSSAIYFIYPNEGTDFKFLIRLDYWLLPIEGKKNIPTVILDNIKLKNFVYDINLEEKNVWQTFKFPKKEFNKFLNGSKLSIETDWYEGEVNLPKLKLERLN